MTDTQLALTDTQIAALRNAGVWPKGLGLVYRDGVVPAFDINGVNIPDAAAEALLIDAMLNALPDEWIMYRRRVCGPGRMNTKNGKCEPAVRVWRVTDMLASSTQAVEDKDKAQALFRALVLAGVVEGEAEP